MASFPISPTFRDYTEPESPFRLLSDPSKYVSAKFRLTNTNVTIANTLRRAILTQTPSIGFRTEPYDKSDVKISINTTPLVNEMIAHRIGMIPINADPEKFDPDLVSFELDVTNKTSEIIDVRARDFKVFVRPSPLEEPIQFPSEMFFPPDPVTGETVLITRLRPQWNPDAPKEQIKLTAKASSSTGAENIRWSPVCQASYEYTRDMNEDNIKVVFHDWLKVHKKIDDPENDTRLVELRKEFDTMEIQRCYVKDAAGNPNDFTFHIESVGIQDNRKIVQTAIASCIALVKKYQDIDKVIPPTVRIQQGDSRFPSIEFVFQNESHTLGNLLETELIEKFIDENITYAGYKVPHPLRPEMFVRIGVKDGLTLDDQKNYAKVVLAKACRSLIETFSELKVSWDALVMHVSAVTDDMPAETLPEAPRGPIILPSGGVTESKDPF